jgi:tetratricopeptide (TPR) repeat protein
MDEKEVFAKIDSLSILTKNYLVITLLGKELSREFQNPKITLSPDAYRYYVYGNRSFYNRDFPTACKMLQEAIREDSNFIEAMGLLSYAYINQSLYEDAKKWCLIRRSKLQEMSLNTDPDPLYSGLFEEPKATINIYKLLLINDKQNPRNYFMIGTRYVSLKQYDKAIPYFEKQLEIYKDLRSKPRWVTSYTSLGSAYHKMGLYRKENKLYKKAEKDFPDNPDLILREAVLALSEGKTEAANNYIEKYLSICKESSASEASLTIDLAGIYSEAGILDKAEEFYRKAKSLEPEVAESTNTLAYFLIENDRNIDEGLDLVEKALQPNPDNYKYLHTKGWGLYKQGKYQEALDTLQKSWDLRREKAIYNHEAFLHLEEAKKAATGMK